MIKINKREPRFQSGEAWFERAQTRTGEYLLVTLPEYSPQSKVHRVWLHQRVVCDIADWVEMSLRQPKIVEVGGYLAGVSRAIAPAGRDEPLLQAQFDVVLETFYPETNPYRSHRSALEIGGVGLANVERLLAQQPGLRVLGWFHTHPGYGPYLSKTDLDTIHQFFRQEDHLSIVLDPLTENFDTGIFSYRADAVMNNRKDWEQWIGWREWAQRWTKNQPDAPKPPEGAAPANQDDYQQFFDQIS